MTDQTLSGGGNTETIDLENYLGPYENWNFGIGNPYTFPAYRSDQLRFLTALVEHAKPLKPGSLSETADHAGKRTWLPTLWGEEDDVALRFWPIVAEKGSGQGELPDCLSLRLKSADETATVGKARFRMAFPVEETAMHDISSRAPAAADWSADPEVPTGREQEKTINVLGVIDDGIAFAHRNFRAADGKRTRLEFCWLQSAEKDTECTKPRVLFGRELTRAGIEKLISLHGEDEDALYAASGASGPQFGSSAAINRLVTHGAHVMDVAGGSDLNRNELPAEETRLVAVQLPNTYPWDTSSFGKAAYLLAAFHYILERAEQIGKGYGVQNIRVTINCSYGFSGGRHDGETELEAAINELVTERRKLGRPTAIVLPSGNTFQDRLHGEISAEDLKKGSYAFTWAVQPNDRTSNYLEMWFPKDFDPKAFSIEVNAPSDRASVSMDLTPDSSHATGDPRRFASVQLAGPHAGKPVGVVSLDNHRRSKRWRVLIALAPTEPDDPELPAAPCGDWSIVLKRGQGAPAEHGAIFLWVQRDVDLEAFRKGNRQSYLKDEAYQITDVHGTAAQTDSGESHVKRFGSINGMATGSVALVVSGCTVSANSQWDSAKPVASIYSSAGKPGGECAVGSVDCTARADRSNINPGVVAAGTRSGSYAVVQGTSVAAPLVARRLAEAFARCSDADVKNAEAENYLPILKKLELQGLSDEDRARLGDFLIL